MDPDVELNRTAWEAASEKHVREYQELLQLAREQSSLIECELDLLRPLLRSLGEIINVVISAGLDVLHVAEHPEPFWRPQNVEAAAWRGQLPNSFTLLARHTRQ